LQYFPTVYLYGYKEIMMNNISIKGSATLLTKLPTLMTVVDLL